MIITDCDDYRTRCLDVVRVEDGAREGGGGERAGLSEKFYLHQKADLDKEKYSINLITVIRDL